MITHDVETANGQRNIGALAALESSYGVRSCWNFVVRRYEVDVALIADLKASGHEVGVHGVYHDGREFASEEEFRRRLGIVETAAREWGANGYRSPSLLFDPELLRQLPFLWDSSMPAWDPFQPNQGDCGEYVPFTLNDGCVELPVTLWQDFTLLEELQMTDVDVWHQQIDAIHSAGGLINLIVHPDYMLAADRINHYEALLQHVTALPDVWIATPSEVARWHQRQSEPK